MSLTGLFFIEEVGSKVESIYRFMVDVEHSFLVVKNTGLSVPKALQCQKIKIRLENAKALRIRFLSLTTSLATGRCSRIIGVSGGKEAEDRFSITKRVSRFIGGDNSIACIVRGYGRFNFNYNFLLFEGFAGFWLCVASLTE